MWVAGVAFFVGGIVLEFVLAKDLIGYVFAAVMSLIGLAVCVGAHRSGRRQPVLVCFESNPESISCVRYGVLKQTSGYGRNRTTTHNAVLSLETNEGEFLTFSANPKRLQELVNAAHVLAPRARFFSGFQAKSGAAPRS